MSSGELHQNLVEPVKAAVEGCAKPRMTFILQWRMEASQNDVHKGFEECGCGFCPDDNPG
jgi:hypothetical protein